MTTEFLPRTRRILDRPFMMYRPFGREPDGEPIRDLTGISIRENVAYLEEVVSAARGPEAGRQAVEDLVKLLNDRIPDRAYHVTSEFLRNPWTGYSNEFVAYLVELCIDLSGDPQFQIHMGEKRLVPPIIQTLMRPFSVQRIYQMAAYFVQYYNKNSYHLDTIAITPDSAVLRMTLTDRASRHFGPYRRACGAIWCNALRIGIRMVPTMTHNLPAANIVDRRCLAEGDECCEWEVTWTERSGAKASGGPLRRLARHYLRNEIEEREKVIEEQLQSLEGRHEELHKAYADLQENAAQLQRRVDQLTTLHEAGLAFTSTLDQDALLDRALQTIIDKLRYDRAMIAFYDADRQVMHNVRVLGVSDEVAAFARSLEIPVPDPDSVEGTVLRQGKPLLVGDIKSVWDRLHPLSQRLASWTNAKSVISVPLKVQRAVLGSLTVDRTEEHCLTEDDLNLMVTVGNQVAIALANAAAYREIEALNVGLEAKVRTRTAELEAANERLQEVDRLKTEFFNNISHELRTPLTLSLGAFKSLLPLSPSPECKERIQLGLRNTSRLLFLINELLDIAKYESGRARLSKRCFDLAAFIRDISSNFEPSIWRRVDLRGVDQPIPIEADYEQLKKVLFNLLSNAFKFSDPDTGRVSIRLRDTDSEIELSVEDNGIGIPREQLDRVFDRFYQVEGSAARRYEGTGIGLALVKEIVSLHGGTISVESEVGRGSTFTIRFPRGTARVEDILPVEGDDTVIAPVIEATAQEEAPAGTSAMESSEGSPLVLVVDDNADMRAYLEKVLRPQYRVALARNGVDALERARTIRPDLILSDVMMPEMCGGDLLRAVRADHTLRTTPVIFVTARIGTDARIESFEAGADDYIHKPFDEQEVLARVGNLIRARAQERQLHELQKEKLSRFLPQHLSEMILSGGAEEFLKGHRREISVLFIDLRGFTAFAETADPEDLMAVLREYQHAMGPLVSEFQGTLERFSGDAMMVYLNDPLPVPNHVEQALRMALAMRDRVTRLCGDWSKRGIELGAGIGIATGHATLGVVGFEGRLDYAAIGTVTNLAARLCGEAQKGQILVPARVMHRAEALVRAEPVSSLTLKGLHQPVMVYNVTGLK